MRDALRLGFGKAKSRFCTIDRDREPDDKVQDTGYPVKSGVHQDAAHPRPALARAERTL